MSNVSLSTVVDQVLMLIIMNATCLETPLSDEIDSVLRSLAVLDSNIFIIRVRHVIDIYNNNNHSSSSDDSSERVAPTVISFLSQLIDHAELLIALRKT